MRRDIEGGRIRNGGKRADSRSCRYRAVVRRIFERGGTLEGLEKTASDFRFDTVSWASLLLYDNRRLSMDSLVTISRHTLKRDERQ